MKLSDFIRQNTEGIAKDWADFARSCEPAAAIMNIAGLRDHIFPLLRFLADDMDAPQTRFEQSEKSQGRQANVRMDDSEAEKHAALRVIDGFTVDQVVGEFRALRASVLRLWANIQPMVLQVELAQVVRFDESVDQMLSESVARHGQLEADVRKSSSRRDAFLTTLSHELRSPLGALSNAAQAAAAIGATDPRLGSATAIMIRQTRHLSRLLNDLLDLARMSRDRLSMDLAAMDVRECVQDAVAANRETITGKSHVLTLEMPDTPLVGVIDGTRIVQVVSNILNNAVKYSPVGSDIKISLTRDADRATISVKDHGPGIDAGMLPNVFEEFYANHEKDLAKSGLGIGLSLSRRLIEMHAGTIVALSEGPGTGAEFRVTIPLQPSVAESVAA